MEAPAICGRTPCTLFFRRTLMRNFLRLSLLVIVSLACTGLALSQTLNPNSPTWWAKYQRLLSNGSGSLGGPSSSVTVGANVDVSNECGPQSETFITLNHSNPQSLAAGSNEIFRLPMRGYFSFDGGSTWGGVDLPLPPPLPGPTIHALDRILRSPSTLLATSSMVT